MIVPIWKIWDQDRIDEQVKKVDKRRITESRQETNKETRITTTLKVTDRLRSNSRVPDYEGETYSQTTFDDLEITHGIHSKPEILVQNIWGFMIVPKQVKPEAPKSWLPLCSSLQPYKKFFYKFVAYYMIDHNCDIDI